jgi:dihydroflavonol-4-reductase
MTPPFAITGRTALVTGASGFVGSAVVRAALREGMRVRAFVRPDSPRVNLDGLDVEIATGDATRRDDLRAALDGIDVLFHVAADYRLWAPDPNTIIEANRAMTEAAMGAAREAGTPRIVYTSSVATLAARTDGQAVDETAPLTFEGGIGAYKKSKIGAERRVEAMVREGLPAVIVNPSTPIGPRDVKPTPTGRILVEAAHGRMPAFVDTGLNVVHVDDVADGHLLAAVHGVVGERYILGGEDVSLAALLGEIARQCGRTPPTVTLPRAPLFPLAYAAEAVARLTGREPFLTADALRMAKYRMFFSSAKARAALGYAPRPWTEAVADALAWFRAYGRIP